MNFSADLNCNTTQKMAVNKNAVVLLLLALLAGSALAQSKWLHSHMFMA